MRQTERKRERQTEQKRERLCTEILSQERLRDERDSPRVEWRALRIRGGNLIQTKSVFWIFRCQSI